MILLTGCSTKPDKQQPSEPVVINKMTYILPPDFLLKECGGEPVDNRIQTVLTAQKKIIDDCNSQLQLLREWKVDKQAENEKNNKK